MGNEVTRIGRQHPLRIEGWLTGSKDGSCFNHASAGVEKLLESFCFCLLDARPLLILDVMIPTIDMCVKLDIHAVLFARETVPITRQLCLKLVDRMSHSPTRVKSSGSNNAGVFILLGHVSKESDVEREEKNIFTFEVTNS